MNKIDKIFHILDKHYSFIPVVTKLSGLRSSSPFMILVAAMISARTKDEVTESAAKRLFRLASTPQKMKETPKSKIEKAIYPVGFYKTKAANIILLSKIISENHGGRIPDKLEELLKLPGVGLKTASLTLNEAFGDTSEICVDTHVHRISNRLGLITTKTPEESASALKKVLPRRFWGCINYLMVSYGKTVCTPQKPGCNECELKQLCKYFINARTKIRYE